jgi:hypothetical protein
VLAFVEAAFLLYVPVPLSSAGASNTAAAAAVFTPAVKAALLAGIAQALGVDVSGVFIASITPYSYRRRRSLYLQPSAGTGVTVSTGILASAAASSPLIMAALGGGAADASAVMAATVTVVQAQMSSGALAAAVAAQPAIVSGLGYSSSAQLVAQLSLDGTPVARAPPAPAPAPSAGSGASGGLVAAVIVVLLVVGAGVGYRFVFAPWRARLRALKEYQSRHPHLPLPMAASAPPATPWHSGTSAAQHEGLSADDPSATIELPMTAAQVRAQEEALLRAEAQLRNTAEEVARSRAQLEAQERAQEQMHAQVLTKAQGLARAVAAQSAATASEARFSYDSGPQIPGQVVHGMDAVAAADAAAAGAGVGLEAVFAGPSTAQLRGGLSDQDFVLDEDVNRFLDAHGLVDVLGHKTSRAPLLVGSLAEVCAAGGRRFVPLATRRLALLGFIASRQDGVGGGGGGEGSEGSAAGGGRGGGAKEGGGDVPAKTA